MSLVNAAFPIGAVYAAPTGGTTVTFTGLGVRDNGWLKGIVTADADIRTRRFFLATAKEPKLNAGSPLGYTMQRNTLKFVYPQMDTINGLAVITPNFVNIEIGYAVNASTATKQALVDSMVQAGLNANLSPLLLTGSLS